MANVTGPTIRLPGAVRSSPKGIMCDDHGDRPAIHRVTGEVDSFGSEEFDMCQECFDAFKADCAADTHTSPCDWCKKDRRLSPTRDPDEGLAGPVYYVCDECKARQAARAAAELDREYPWSPESDDF